MAPLGGWPGAGGASARLAAGSSPATSPCGTAAGAIPSRRSACALMALPWPSPVMRLLVAAPSVAFPGRWSARVHLAPPSISTPRLPAAGAPSLLDGAGPGSRSSSAAIWSRRSARRRRSRSPPSGNVAPSMAASRASCAASTSADGDSVLSLAPPPQRCKANSVPWHAGCEGRRRQHAARRVRTMHAQQNQALFKRTTATVYRGTRLRADINNCSSDKYGLRGVGQGRHGTRTCRCARAAHADLLPSRPSERGAWLAGG